MEQDSSLLPMLSPLEDAMPDVPMNKAWRLRPVSQLSQRQISSPAVSIHRWNKCSPLDNPLRRVHGRLGFGVIRHCDLEIERYLGDRALPWRSSAPGESLPAEPDKASAGLRPDAAGPCSPHLSQVILDRLSVAHQQTVQGEDDSALVLAQDAG